MDLQAEKLPIAQKNLIKKANIAKKPVIVAIQMLKSMIDNPIPTRAETAMGKYPVEAVNTMKNRK